MSQGLPKELTSLVDWSVSELGQVILSELGSEKFARIEGIRRFVKSSECQSLTGLLKLKDQLQRLTSQERFDIAHAFALMLELINSCEAAYRTFRLKSEFKETQAVSSEYGRVIHVLTAHPTEARNADIVYFFRKIQKLLISQLELPLKSHQQELQALLQLAWKIPMSKQRKPSVMDEAEYIYSLVLQKDIIDIFIKYRDLGQPFYIRTWVGGDKDGHPGVDEKAMLGSLQMSRGYLLNWVLVTFASLVSDLEPFARTSARNHKATEPLYRQAIQWRKNLQGIKKIKSGDASRISNLRQALEKLIKQYKQTLNSESVDLQKIHSLFKIFPALVVPLELREDSGVVHEALNKARQPFAIIRMLKTLHKISPQQDVRFYVRGFILSQTEGSKDLIAGVNLVKKYLGEARLPVVPLFESASSLKRGPEIIAEFLKSSRHQSLVRNTWSAKFEIMLGYSDSAKENGSFPSRFLIHSAVESLEKLITSYKMKPIFFHGSGGSIERGGGSVQEQTAWWPTSALETVKVTVQGEMIYRNYTAAEILERQLQRFASARKQTENGLSVADQQKLESDLQRLSDFVQAFYQETLKSSRFLELIEVATPYSYLKELKLGSRPTKRQGPVNLKGLRAIPWVLCWTQTRALFPTWWGVGRFWKTLDKSEKARFRFIFLNSPLFSSYLKVLGFTLAKVDLNIFSLYLDSSSLPKDVSAEYLERFQQELRDCKDAVRELTQEKSLLWYRPWLEKSIELRSPLIHPLNVLQLLALQDKDIPLLRETVTGVASGMLTTG